MVAYPWRELFQLLLLTVRFMRELAHARWSWINSIEKRLVMRLQSLVDWLEFRQVAAVSGQPAFVGSKPQLERSRLAPLLMAHYDSMPLDIVQNCSPWAIFRAA